MALINEKEAPKPKGRTRKWVKGGPNIQKKRKYGRTSERW